MTMAKRVRPIKIRGRRRFGLSTPLLLAPYATLFLFFNLLLPFSSELLDNAPSVSGKYLMSWHTAPHPICLKPHGMSFLSRRHLHLCLCMGYLQSDTRLSYSFFSL